MGLKDRRKFEFNEFMNEFLKKFDISYKDLSYLHDAIEYIKEKKKEPINNVKNIEVSEEQKKKIEEAKKKVTPEQIIEQFAGQTEEFNFDGR